MYGIFHACMHFLYNIKSKRMKKILFAVAFFAIAFAHASLAQDTQQQSQLSQLLTQYYSIKDALVAGNPITASAKAEEFVKTLNGIDYKVISEGNVNALLKDAGAISETKDINRQRVRFANFSANMVTLAKGIKLSDQPIYEAYCPMKKASWLTSEKSIKNPYYGSGMLTCGKITGTLN
jgi:hypothetical protein